MAHDLPMRGIDIIGWTSSFILLATLIRQVYKQWRTRSHSGVSKWLFVGQVTASIGYVAYSWMLQNWVFLASNLAILATALAGELIYLRSKNGTKPSEVTP